ncbi:fibronectin type III domain-containing protein [Salinibacter sp.]|uniref:fibronectin type III domain-containing protein n=1 Tax=Salinibacter sp. TaxID=2065818 RepID=UPI0021E7692B|nr:fibronectin type III domain-containing protein [Salinibacter sp.]
MASDDGPAPSLVTPVDAVSADGSAVTFVWSPVEDGDAYRLQVAETARFDTPVVDAEVGTQTAVTVGNKLPTDGQTFFWRVLVERDGEWGPPSPVESFVATTEAEAEQGPAEAADEEPVTELARAARQEATAQPFDFEDQIEKEKERGVAYEGVAASQIMGISASIIAVVLTAVAILFGWFGQVSQSAEGAAAERMQYRDIKQAEMEAAQELQQYEVVDEEEGTYRIPIDRAMDLVAREEYQQRQQPE